MNSHRKSNLQFYNYYYSIYNNINGTYEKVYIPWILSICPSFKAAPLTLHKVFTIRSALACVKNGLWSNIAIAVSEATKSNYA